jgi:hypothetical protein
VSEFLSPEWLHAFDAAVRDVEAPPADQPLDARFVIEQVVTDVPGRGEVRYRFVVTAAGARVDPTVGDDPFDVRFTTDFPTAVALAQGKENAQRALGAGRLRLGGDIAAIAAHAEALSIFEEACTRLRETTTYGSA